MANSNKRQQARNRDTSTSSQEGRSCYTSTLRDGRVYVRKGKARGQTSVAAIFDLATRKWLKQHADVPESLKRDIEQRYALVTA